MSNTGEISFELYKWLSSLQVITSSQKYKPNGNIQLESKIYDELVSGQLMAKLIEILAVQLKVQLNGPLISSIKKSNTPASRVYNWNVLSQSFAKIGIALSKQMQKQITSGNFDELKRFLIEIYRKMQPKKSDKVQLSKQDTQDELDFAKIQKYKNYGDCQTVLDCIVKMISKTCGLTLKQAFSTLSENLKYFSHMVVKGIKNSFEQIENLYKCIITNMPHLMYLCEKDPARNTAFLLQLAKPTLISRQPQVALYGSKTLKAIIYESLKYNSKNLVYQILTTQPSGFDFIYMGIKRHPHLAGEHVEFLHRIIQNTYKQFFQVHLKNLINNEAQYIKTIIIMLEGIKLMEEARKNVIQSGLLKLWVKMCQESFNSVPSKKQVATNNSTEQAKILSLELLCDLWKIFSTQLDEAEAQDLLMKGIEELKKNTRKDNYMIKISALNRLFDFLDFLALHKNRIASIVYKKTIFLLFQNHEDTQIRQVILQNFSLILKKYPTIPIQFLLEPLLKQLMKQEGQSYILNIFDFEFFIQVFKHPKLEAQWALNFLQYFTKLYTKNIIYSGIVIRIIELLGSRFCEQAAVMQSIIKNVQNNLNVYGMLAIGKKTYLKGRQQKLMNSQRKSLIIELIKYYIKLQNQIINDAIKSKVSKLYVQWIDTKNHTDKGLEYLLTFFGEIDQLIMKERIQKDSYKNQSNQGINTRQRNSPIQHNDDQNPVSLSLRQKHNIKPSSLSVKNVFNSGGLNDVSAKHGKQKQKQKQDYDFFSYQNYQNDYSRATPMSKKTKPQSHKKLSVNDSKSQNVKSKTRQDIQLYKKKYQHRQSQRQKQRQYQQRSNQTQIIIPKVNPTQLAQRNISMGYNKLLKPQQLLYQIDTVKTKYLKEQTQLVDLQEMEERDIVSTRMIFKKYQKYIETLFYRYTALGHIANRSPIQQKVFISFSDLNRMLKQKGMNKLPKIVVNQIITHINRKKKYNINVLVGIQEKEFNNFLILFSNLYLKDQRNLKDQPFGLKLQKILMKMFQNQYFYKQLSDKKAQQWFQKNQIQNLELEAQQAIPALQGYKKVVNEQVRVKYKIVDNNIGQTNQICFETLNQIFKKGMNIDLFSGLYETKKMTRIVPLVKVPKPMIPQVLTQKLFKKDVQTQKSSEKNINVSKSTTLRQNGSTSKIPKQGAKRESLFKAVAAMRTKSQRQLQSKKLNKTELLGQEIAKKFKEQGQYAKKLRDQLEVMRQQRQKKVEQQKQKIDLQQKQKQKKQQKQKKYLQENKKKIQQKKSKQQQQKKQQEQKQKQQKMNKKQDQKQKQKKLLQKRQKQIEQQKSKLQQKKKSQQIQIKKLQNMQKKAKKSVNQNQKQQNQQIQKQKRLILAVTDQKSQYNQIANQNQKQIKILFDEYCNWKTNKIELKDIALMMKNFKVSPQYIPPRIISETFKTFAKGDSASIQQFKQLLIKYAYKSQKLATQVTVNTGKEFQPEILKKFLTEKLYMKSFNYQQKIKQAKLQQL